MGFDHRFSTVLNLDPGKLLIIGVVAILVLGPDRLPQVARQIGGMWRSFNEFRQRMEGEVRSNIPDLPSTSEIARLARSPSALLDSLATMHSADEPLESPIEGQEPTSGDSPIREDRVTTGAMRWVTADFSEPEQMDSDLSGTECHPAPRAAVQHSGVETTRLSVFDATLN